MPEATDATLVAATLAGQLDAFGDLVRRHQRRVFLGLLQLCGDADQAEEITQESFCRAYTALSTFDPAYRFSPWLFQIALNVWRNQLRSAGPEAPWPEVDTGQDEPEAYVLPDMAPSPEEAALSADLNRRVWQAVAALPVDARAVVVMRHALGLSYAEIASATEMPLGTVKSRLARARAALAVTLRGLVD